MLFPPTYHIHFIELLPLSGVDQKLMEQLSVYYFTHYCEVIKWKVHTALWYKHVYIIFRWRYCVTFPRSRSSMKFKLQIFKFFFWQLCPFSFYFTKHTVKTSIFTSASWQYSRNSMNNKLNYIQNWNWTIWSVCAYVCMPVLDCLMWENAVKGVLVVSQFLFNMSLLTRKLMRSFCRAVGNSLSTF